MNQSQVARCLIVPQLSDTTLKPEAQTYRSSTQRYTGCYGKDHLKQPVTTGEYQEALLGSTLTTSAKFVSTLEDFDVKVSGDDKGYIHLMGQLKEVLILNRKNYSSFELEYSLETSGIAGLTAAFTAVFSTWGQTQQSEAVVVLFNPSEEAIGSQKLRETLQAIERASRQLLLIESAAHDTAAKIANAQVDDWQALPLRFEEAARRPCLWGLLLRRSAFVSECQHRTQNNYLEWIHAGHHSS